MAGTNQAANLSGMLSSFANDMGRPVDISGLTNNIRDMGRPQLDVNDPESLERYATWAGRTGRTQEAQTYGALAASKREENKELNSMRAADAVVGQADRDVLGGNPAAVEAQIQKLRKQLETAPAGARGQIQQAIANLQGRRTEAKTNRTNGNLQAVDQIDRLLEDETLSEKQRSQLEESRAKIINQDSETSKAHDDRLLDKAKADSERYRLQQEEANKQVIKLLYGPASRAEQDEAIANMPPSQKAFAEAERARIEERAVAAMRRDEELKTLTDTSNDVSEVLNSYDALDDQWKGETGRALSEKLKRLREEGPGSKPINSWRADIRSTERALASELGRVDSQKAAQDAADKALDRRVDWAVRSGVTAVQPSDKQLVRYILQSGIVPNLYEDSDGKFKEFGIKQPFYKWDGELTDQELILKYGDQAIAQMRSEREKELRAIYGAPAASGEDEDDTTGEKDDLSAEVSSLYDNTGQS